MERTIKQSHNHQTYQNSLVMSLNLLTSLIKTVHPPQSSNTPLFRGFSKEVSHKPQELNRKLLEFAVSVFLQNEFSSYFNKAFKVGDNSTDLKRIKEALKKQRK